MMTFLIETSMIGELKEERYVFNLLKHIFWAEQSHDFLKDIAAMESIPEEDGLDKGLNTMVSAVKSNNGRLDKYTEELAVEFARLFIGPKNPPAIPYASFYLSESKSMMSDVTIDVRKMYLDAGMAVKELYSFPDDHIAIELEFLQSLTERIIELFKKGNREEASNLYGLREHFLTAHFSKWVTSFADNIITSTNEDFYRGAAHMLKGLA
jgi:TorA maturation chaperone TorD